MKVRVKHIKCDMSKKDRDLMNKFIKYLGNKYPLKNDVSVIFTGERFGEMSTGSRTTDSELKIYTKGRMNRDVARTLAHEWVHEWQINTKNKKMTGDIGGPLEDEANAKAGSVIKQFEKDNPKEEGMMYESVQNKINLINEQLLLTEKENIRKDFILEMKKIGIDKLPYSYSAMKQFVDPETMDIHYNKHYKGYVKKLNDALSKKKYKYEDLEDIVKSISKFDTKIRNNAGGAFNHALFWKMLSPKKQLPKGEILDKINKQYGNIKKLKDEFNETAKERFGSGWVWLILTKTNRLKVMSTPNQDNPLMNIIKDGGYPLLGLDLWEHAYYLRYRNKRDEYIKKFWNHINWEFVNELFVSKTKKKLNESYLKVLLENDGTQKDVKKLMSRELQKIRLIPLDAEAANDAINNIITSEVERGLKFNRTIEGLMTLDLSNVSERSKFRFNNYFQRFVKSRTRGYDFEALISGLLGGEMATSLTSPYDLISAEGEKISCKIVRNSSEKINLKSIRKSVTAYIKQYNGSPENKKILDELAQYPNFITLVLTHESQDIRNCAEDILTNLLQDVDGMLIGIPNSSGVNIKLFYYDRDKLIQLAKIPEFLNAAKTKGSQTITFSPKILTQTPTMNGILQFPILTNDDYVAFLSSTPSTTNVVNLLNSFGQKYGVFKLGDNVPQDIIRQLSNNKRFQLDLSRLTK
jgi:Fe-Mn family superoxide dismutase